MDQAALVSIAELSTDQWGLITTAQADDLGISRTKLTRMTAIGLLERMGRGVYAVTAAPQDHLTHTRAVWLALDPVRTVRERMKHLPSAGVISHQSAALLQGLGTLLADELHVTYPHRRQTRRDDVRLHLLPLDGADVTVVDGLPVTTPERTAADLVTAHHDLEHVSQVVGDGVLKGILDTAALADRLGPLAARSGHGDGVEMVQALLDMADLGATAVERSISDLSGLNVDWGRAWDLRVDTSKIAARMSALVRVEEMLRPLREELAKPARRVTASLTPQLRATIDQTAPLAAQIARLAQANKALMGKVAPPQIESGDDDDQ
jgi:hypothetical protein